MGIYGQQREKYREFWPFLKNKLQRLLIPYIVFAFVFMLTTNSWSWYGLYSGAYSHLWFLSMLFWCFVIAAAINQWKLAGSIWIRLGLLIISFISLIYARISSSFVGITFLHLWFFWFYLGFVVYSYRQNVYNWIKRSIVVPYILTVIYCLCMWYMVEFIGDYGTDFKCFISELGFLSIVIWIWYMLCWLIERFGTGWTQCRLIKELSTCSFGIYIFHNWIEPYMISRTAQRLLPLAEWAANHTVLFPLVFSLLALLISYIMTKIVLMTKVGRALIG